jgi:25S rRNA (uracil2634-N3)-methyltransferase
MYLPKNCLVITIGDGDLSLSRALLAYVSHEGLIATTYDSEDVLRNKHTQNTLDDLVNDLASIRSLPYNFADIVIFNHPLVPRQRSHTQTQKERDKVRT